VDRACLLWHRAFYHDRPRRQKENRTGWFGTDPAAAPLRRAATLQPTPNRPPGKPIHNF